MDTSRTSSTWLAIRAYFARHYAAFSDQLRAAPWLGLGLVLLVLVAWSNRDYLAFLAWAVCKVALGAYVGYRIDRSVFPYERPHALEGIARGTATKRRALIVAACVLALGLAP